MLYRQTVSANEEERTFTANLSLYRENEGTFSKNGIKYPKWVGSPTCSKTTQFIYIYIYYSLNIVFKAVVVTHLPTWNAQNDKFTCYRL